MKNTTTPGPWIYQPETKTIRSVPANYWIATMDSWDGSVDSEANARLISAAPELLKSLEGVMSLIEEEMLVRNTGRDTEEDWYKLAARIISVIGSANEAIEKATQP